MNVIVRDPGPIDVRYESLQVINGVEYVTAEQHRKGMAQAAERGLYVDSARLQNSPRTRAKVEGMSAYAFVNYVRFKTQADAYTGTPYQNFSITISVFTTA